VADLDHLWVTLQVPAEDQERVLLGQRAAFRPDGAGFVVEGRVTWVGAEVDEMTRALPVRVEVAGQGDRLKANAFGVGWITVRDAPEAVVVPEEAVHWEGCHDVVFVRVRDDLFQTRKVRLGVRDGGQVEILAGVLPGEVIATRGSHVLAAELLKGKLGAGCCAE
jgi:multidrug efflux pump subunit AcrA (membrane-fusion protein)